MTTVVEPSTIQKDDNGIRVLARSVMARDLRKGMIVTNIGIIDAINQVGVFVIAAVRGTVWSLADGMGDIRVLDVVWHESNQVSVDNV